MLSFNVLVTYELPNGKTKQRENRCFYHEVGYVNQFGWKVINVQHYFDGRYYSKERYEELHKEALRKLYEEAKTYYLEEIRECVRKRKKIRLYRRTLKKIDLSNIVLLTK